MARVQIPPATEGEDRHGVEEVIEMHMKVLGAGAMIYLLRRRL